MRFETYHVSAQLVRELEGSGNVRRIIDDGGDIIHLELFSGQSLMIYLIESHIPLYEIRNILTANGENGVHTLFILWSDMLLPGHGRLYQPHDWHLGLMALYGDRVYGYEIYRQHVYIYPVHFERLMGRTECRIHHGEPIDVAGLRCHRIATDMPGLQGEWYVADFSGAPHEAHRQRAEDAGLPYASALAEYYALLQIEPGADREAVKQAYRRLARRYHPDVNDGDASATRRMQQINHAYRVIIRALDGE